MQPDDIAAIARGLREAMPGDFADDAIRMTIRAQDALKNGTGMRLSYDEVNALQILAGGDGDWWGTIDENRKALRAHLAGETPDAK